MYGSDWRDGAVAIRDYVRQSSNHHHNGDNQGDGLTAGIRKHELLKHRQRFEVTPHCPGGLLFLSLSILSVQEQVSVVFVGPVL
jgi:hypothetical protein